MCGWTMEELMDFNIKTLDAKNTLASIKTGCIVVGIH